MGQDKTYTDTPTHQAHVPIGGNMFEGHHWQGHIREPSLAGAYPMAIIGGDLQCHFWQQYICV
jgi:hypothetical protein